MNPNYGMGSMGLGYGAGPANTIYGIGPVDTSNDLRPVNANYGMIPAYANSGMIPAYANNGMAPAYANNGMAPAYANNGMAPAYANSGMAPAYANNGMIPAHANNRPLLNQPRNLPRPVWPKDMSIGRGRGRRYTDACGISNGQPSADSDPRNVFYNGFGERLSMKNCQGAPRGLEHSIGNGRVHNGPAAPRSVFNDLKTKGRYRNRTRDVSEANDNVWRGSPDLAPSFNRRNECAVRPNAHSINNRRNGSRPGQNNRTQEYGRRWAKEREYYATCDESNFSESSESVQFEEEEEEGDRCDIELAYNDYASDEEMNRTRTSACLDSDVYEQNYAHGTHQDNDPRNANHPANHRKKPKKMFMGKNNFAEIRDSILFPLSLGACAQPEPVSPYANGPHYVLYPKCKSDNFKKPEIIVRY